MVKDVLDSLVKGEEVVLRSLQVELWPVPLAKVRDVGLSEHWVKLIEQKKSRRHLLGNNNFLYCYYCFVIAISYCFVVV